jgi:hypothetical protein
MCHRYYSDMGNIAAPILVSPARTPALNSERMFVEPEMHLMMSPGPFDESRSVQRNRRTDGFIPITNPALTS